MKSIGKDLRHLGKRGLPLIRDSKDMLFTLLLFEKIGRRMKGKEDNRVPGYGRYRRKKIKRRSLEKVLFLERESIRNFTALNVNTF